MVQISTHVTLSREDGEGSQASQIAMSVFPLRALRILRPFAVFAAQGDVNK